VYLYEKFSSGSDVSAPETVIPTGSPKASFVPARLISVAWLGTSSSTSAAMSS